jgi:hypothetical protein
MLMLLLSLAPEFLFAQTPIMKVPVIRKVAVPDSLKTTRERADYLAIHYWDLFDFDDTTYIDKPGMTEQSFSNYIGILPYADSRLAEQGMSALLHRADNGTGMFDYFVRLTEKYLYEPNSPLFNEELYVPVLQYLVNSKRVDTAKKETYAFRLKMALKNRKGTMVADFTFLDTKGESHSLYGTSTDRNLLLVFFDPECDHCVQVLSRMRTEPNIMIHLMNGSLSVLAVYAEGKKKIWEEHKNTLPDTWMVGFDKSKVSEKSIYDLKAMPTIYLLDKNKTVLLKDAQLNQVISFLLQSSTDK